ncbi:c-type cytochrome [Pseudogemmobacter bohemicus]|uniref:c-type cytochrome n=1 Tax=Pseudogemmobacter bohemicus TaxID=2250708 RepID=UPI000DD47DF0|nr:cytochrome c [Pseudogemmobacter bohemicus]
MLFLIAALAGAVMLWLIRPDPLDGDAMAGLTGAPEAGRLVFLATGCASCHLAPGQESSDAERPVLAGGQAFPSDFGTFYAPNISPDPEHGIGAWSALDLANALTRGVSREGAHLYPALPYASYAKLTLQDVADLDAWLKTLPADATPSREHDVAFPFSQRWLLGGWKLLFLRSDWVVTADLTPEEERGRYLAEAMAHCGECHTPRNALGGMDTARWLAGAPNPSGRGKVPGITPATLDWSAVEIADYLTTGFTPDYDSVGGHMAHVVENFARLPAADAAAVAAYLKRVPPAE